MRRRPHECLRTRVYVRMCSLRMSASLFRYVSKRARARASASTVYIHTRYTREHVQAVTSDPQLRQELAVGRREREGERERRQPMSACESSSLQHLSPDSRTSLRAFRLCACVFVCVCASRAHERRMRKGRRREREMTEGYTRIREADCDCLEIYSSSVAALG